MTEQLTLSLHFHFFLMRDGSTLMALHSVSLGKKKVRRESRLKDGKNITNGIVKHTVRKYSHFATESLSCLSKFHKKNQLNFD